MFPSRFFWKLYLTFAGLVLVTLSATGFLVHQQLRAGLLADTETRLLNMATALSPYALDVFARHETDSGLAGQSGGQVGARRTDSSGAERGADAAGVGAELALMGEQTDTRITLVAPDGVVVADSDEDPAVMDNHGARPEIVASKARPYGVSRRFSQTLEQSLLYVAITVRDDSGEAGTIRTAIPLVDVDSRLAELRNTIALGAGLGMLIALGVGLVAAKRITAPVSRMTEVAEGLREGRYDLRVTAGGNDEFGLLAETLNELADELTNRIATLAGQRAQLGAMVAGLQHGVFAVDDDDNLILHNRAARKLLDLEDGMSGETLWNAVAAPELVELCRQARQTGQPAASEIRIVRGDVLHAIDARVTSFEADGRHGAVAVLHDITNLRRLESMRSEFVANVSHELKTPLTSIRGYVETLIGGALHDEANNLRFLHKIEHQVDRLTAMVSDVLSLARIEATGRDDARDTIDWRSVVSGVIERYREAGKLHEHVCTIETGDEPVAIAGDAESMTQVLDNLLDNAIKYTPPGGAITVTTRNEGSFAVLEVEDTGIGISAADRERIFERFFRADRARSRDTGGTGLGLAIVKHLAQRFGGEVRVSSKLGHGSRFEVRAPRPAISAASS